MWKFIERVLWEMSASYDSDEYDDLGYYEKQGYLDSILTFIPSIMEDPEFLKEKDTAVSEVNRRTRLESEEDNNNLSVDDKNKKIAEIENGPSTDESQRPKSVILKIEVYDEEKEMSLQVQLEDEGEGIPLILRENSNADQLDGQETKPFQDELHDDQGESISLI